MNSTKLRRFNFVIQFYNYMPKLLPQFHLCSTIHVKMQHLNQNWWSFTILIMYCRICTGTARVGLPWKHNWKKKRKGKFFISVISVENVSYKLNNYLRKRLKVTVDTLTVDHLCCTPNIKALVDFYRNNF